MAIIKSGNSNAAVNFKKYPNGWLSSPSGIATGVVVGAAIVVGVIYGTTRMRTPKPTTTAPRVIVTPTQTNSPTATLTPTATSYNGTYKGNTKVAEGLADVTVTVNGTTLTGTATYKGYYYKTTVSLPATILGTVSSTGAVTATVSVKGTAMGVDVSLTGPAKGQITGKALNATYTVTGSGMKYSGAVALTK